MASLSKKKAVERHHHEEEEGVAERKEGLRTVGVARAKFVLRDV